MANNKTKHAGIIMLSLAILTAGVRPFSPGFNDNNFAKNMCRQGQETIIINHGLIIIIMVRVNYDQPKKGDEI